MSLNPHQAPRRMPSLLDIYSENEVRAALEHFRWKRDDRHEGWKRREGLSEALLAALRGGRNDELLGALREIHRWGLPGRFPDSVETRIANVRSLLGQIQARELDVEALTALLELDGVGIATVSKWICFLDQSRYAIYDSRVSVALREMRDENNDRYLPVMPRRSSKTRTPWPADSVTPSSMALCYFDYLALAQDAARELKTRDSTMNTAKVEMALFMIGDITCDDPEKWKEGRGRLRKIQRDSAS